MNGLLFPPAGQSKMTKRVLEVVIVLLTATIAALIIAFLIYFMHSTG